MIKVADLFAKLGLKVDKKSFTAGDKLITGIKTALGGIIAIKSVSAFRDMIQDVSNAADRYNKFSKSVGISSESLQGLDFAAQLSGTDVNVLGTGLQRFARNADAANRGSKLAKETFSELGIAFKDANGELRQSDLILEDVADKFANMPDGTQKTAFAMNLFGRAGAQLIPLLNSGAQGIRDMKQEFADLGGLISTETGAEFEAFNDEQLKLQVAMGGIRKQVVVALLPALRKITGEMLDWVKANGKFIRQQLGKFLEGVVKVVGVFLKAGMKIIEFMNYLSEHSEFVIMLLGSMAAAFLLLKLSSIGAAIASAAAWIAALFPFVLLAAAIAAVILIVEDLWKAFTGGQSVFKELWIVAKRDFFDPLYAEYKKIFTLLKGLVVGLNDEEAKEIVDAYKRRRGMIVTEQIDPKVISDRLSARERQLDRSRELKRRRRPVESVIKSDDQLQTEVDALRRQLRSASQEDIEVQIEQRRVDLKRARALSDADPSSEQFRREVFSAEAALRELTQARGPQGIQQTNTLNANIVVNAQGEDGDGIAEKASQAVREMWDQEMRKAAAGASR